MSNNPAPFPKRANALTDAINEIGNANRMMGTPVGQRVVPVETVGEAFVPTTPLTDEEKRAREEEYLARTGEVVPDSILAKEGLRSGVATVGEPWVPPSMRIPAIAVSRMQPIDFSDIHSIDFKTKTIVVAGTTLPLTEEWYQTFAENAAAALIDSMIEAGKRAKDRLLPARSTDGEQVMPEVQHVETTEGIQ